MGGSLAESKGLLVFLQPSKASISHKDLIHFLFLIYLLIPRVPNILLKFHFKQPQSEMKQ